MLGNYRFYDKPRVVIRWWLLTQTNFLLLVLLPEEEEMITTNAARYFELAGDFGKADSK